MNFDRLSASYLTHNIGAIRNNGHIFMGFQQGIHGGLAVCDLVSLEPLHIFCGEPGGIDVNLAGMVKGLIDILSAPLVNDKIFRIPVVGIKIRRCRVGAHDGAELITAKALFAAAGHKEVHTDKFGDLQGILVAMRMVITISDHRLAGLTVSISDGLFH